MKTQWMIRCAGLVCAVGAFLSCSKEDAYVGSDDDRSERVKQYPMGVVNILVVDNLVELENALYVDNYLSGNLRSSSYDTGGHRLSDDDACWEVLRSTRGLSGLQISKIPGRPAWRLTFSGAYDLASYAESYETTYEMVAEQRPSDADGSFHFDWNVSISGHRYERAGYACSFCSVPVLEYDVVYSTSRWGYCYGTLYMEVTKGNTLVDAMVLRLRGGQSESEFHRGL